MSVLLTVTLALDLSTWCLAYFPWPMRSAAFVQSSNYTDDTVDLDRLHIIMDVWAWERVVLAILVFALCVRRFWNLTLVPVTGPMILAVFDTLTNRDFLAYMIVIFLTVFMFTLPFNFLWSGLVANFNTVASSYLRILDAMFEWELLVLDVSSLPADYYLADSHGVFALSWLRFIFANKMFYLLWMFISLVLMNLFIGIMTDLYPKMQQQSQQEWEEMITLRMSHKVRKELGDMKKTTNWRSFLNAHMIFSSGSRRSFILKGVRDAAKRMHVLRGADGLHFWSRQDGDFTHYDDPKGFDHVLDE